VIAKEVADLVRRGLEQWQLEIDADAPEKYGEYAEMLVDWNTNRFNLTRLISPTDIALGHILDSLSLLLVAALPSNGRLMDIGSGAGFPGLALKIARPDLDVALVDSTRKKLDFCTAVSSALGLTSVNYFPYRAEDGGMQRRLAAHYDIVTARAVSSLADLIALGAPYLRFRGVLAAWKGPRAVAEIEGAEESARKRHLVVTPANVRIPMEEPARTHVIVLCRKI
jgi:16S rRNA (guanine527-N7)-methyltransferase